MPERTACVKIWLAFAGGTRTELGMFPVFLDTDWNLRPYETPRWRNDTGETAYYEAVIYEYIGGPSDGVIRRLGDIPQAVLPRQTMNVNLTLWLDLPGSDPGERARRDYLAGRIETEEFIEAMDATSNPRDVR